MGDQPEEVKYRTLGAHLMKEHPDLAKLIL